MLRRTLCAWQRGSGKGCHGISAARSSDVLVRSCWLRDTCKATPSRAPSRAAALPRVCAARGIDAPHRSRLAARPFQPRRESSAAPPAATGSHRPPAGHQAMRGSCQAPALPFPTLFASRSQNGPKNFPQPQLDPEWIFVTPRDPKFLFNKTNTIHQRMGLVYETALLHYNASTEHHRPCSAHVYACRPFSRIGHFLAECLFCWQSCECHILKSYTTCVLL